MTRHVCRYSLKGRYINFSVSAPRAARSRHTTTLDDDANANANARTSERTSERTANERRTTWRSRRRCDASANARTNATRTRRCAKMRFRCPEGLTADARRRRWRETPIAFFVTSSETPTTCVRGRARGGGEGEERARVLRFDVSSRLVSSRLVSSRARARSDARYFLSRRKLDQKGHQNDLMTLLISSGTRVEMD